MKNLKMFSTLLAFVMLIVAVKSTTWIDYRLEVKKPVLPSPARSPFRSLSTWMPACTTPGRLCVGCKDVYLCDSKNRATKVWTCGTNETCDNGRCTTTPNFECSPPGLKRFPCQMEGIFPDPGSCFKYHICVAINDFDTTIIKSHEERTCKIKYANYGLFQYAYNPRTGYCDKKMYNNTCPGYAVPMCNEPGQTGALSENPSIYYTCREYEELLPVTDQNGELVEQEAVLYPFLEICDNGLVYDAENFTCK